MCEGDFASGRHDKPENSGNQSAAECPKSTSRGTHDKSCIGQGPNAPARLEGEAGHNFQGPAKGRGWSQEPPTPAAGQAACGSDSGSAMAPWDAKVK